MPYTFNRGIRIYWEEEGRGEPLVMIMGLGFSLAMWRNLRPSMARHFRIIVYDNRGVGKSDVPLGRYSIAAMARDAISVLDAAGIPAAHLLGMSMGGMIAQEVALSFPQRVNKLVLGCTSCSGRRSAPEVRQALFSHPFMSRKNRIAALLPFIYDPHTPRDRVEQDIQVLRQNPTPALGFLGQLLGIASWQCCDRLPRISAPTLVIHGESDRLIPPENATILAGRIPGAKLVILPQASHIFPTDQPERSERELLDFLTVHAGS
jgi:pimeloyl-ACP methyl ester carboxylesterase